MDLELKVMKFLQTEAEGADLHVVGGDGLVFLDWETLAWRVMWMIRQRARLYDWPEAVVEQLERDMQLLLRCAITNQREHDPKPDLRVVA